MRKHAFWIVLAAVVSSQACQPGGEERVSTEKADAKLLDKYTTVRLTTDVGQLTAARREMIPLLIQACQQMDAVFWKQAFGNRTALLSSLADSDLQRFAEINYGPWDRLDDNRPFVAGHGPKPPGANFYPTDMTKEEFERAVSAGNEVLQSLYTLVRRDPRGGLIAVPYREAFTAEHQRAADLLRAAARLAESAGLRRYLELRAEALLTDQYQPSDLAWMDMKDNTLDVVIGPIETYEDQLFGYKAAHEGYVLVKDQEWSQRLARYARLLPGLQRGLPVPDSYKRETPGIDSDLNAYDVIYYAGDCNAGSKTIAINLPNDERVQLEKGTRRLQLKNAMRAKFDEILVPIARELIDPDQVQHVTFDAFFANTMFHEVAHGLGIKETINGRGSVRTALKEQASALEEGKADVLGLYMVTRLSADGELPGGSLQDNYVTFLSSIFRSIRFGASSAHGRANLVRFNFFRERGAFSRDAETGRYRVDMDEMRDAMNALSETILRLQGDGDYDGVVTFMERHGQMDSELKGALEQLARAGIPVDIVFEQGVEVLGL